jgi:serine/threonine protein kinase
MLGTVDYLSPEQAIDSHNVDIRSDIYSQGCTLYFLIAGTPPFPRGTLAERLLAHQSQPPTPLIELRPGIPESLAEIVERMIAKQPEDRYQAPGEVAAALGDWLAANPDSPTVPADETTGSVQSSRTTGRPRAVRQPSPESQASTVVKKVIAAPVSPSTLKKAPRASDKLDGASELDGEAIRPLAECWERWAVVVDSLVSRGSFGLKVNEASYQLIYQQLLQTCRGSFADADEPTRLTLRKIEDLAAPWPTLRSLNSILQSGMNETILHHFDEIDRILRARPKPFLSGQVATLLVVLVGASALIYSLFW